MTSLLSGRRPQLDGIRAFAVLIVFAAHASGRVPGGFVGVSIFFTLSGILITSLLVTEYDRTGRIDRGAFYMRRLLRLYPAVIAALLGVAVLTPWIGFGWGRYAVDVVTSLTYTFNFSVLNARPSLVGHFWSLSVEEQYYLLWPPVLLVLLRRGTRYAVKGTAVALAAAVAVSALMLPLVGGGRLYLLPFGRASEILVGSLVGLLLCVSAAPRLRLALMAPATPWIAAAVLGVVAMTVGDIRAGWLYSGGLTALAAVAAALIGHVLLVDDGPAARLLRVAPLVWLGRRSYAFYLWHGLAIAVLRETGQSRAVVVAGSFVLTLAACAVSWRAVEQPFLLIKRRWERSGERLPA